MDSILARIFTFYFIFIILPIWMPEVVPTLLLMVPIQLYVKVSSVGRSLCLVLSRWRMCSFVVIGG